jgi:FAD/FMN-containing dehydrogenase/Fe-S oxidoreductase
MGDLRIADVSSRPIHGARGAPGATAEAALHQLEHANVGEVRLGRHDRMLYATDASIYQVEPLAVVFPRTIGDVERAVAFCAQHRLPVLCRGGGTSLAGQAVNEAVVIDTSRHLTAIAAIDADRRRAHVEPGVVLEQLNRAAAAHGLMFGPDVATASHATLGGMIGNNSAGAHSTLYGHTADHVVAIDALLADGTPVTLHEGAGDQNELVRDLTTRLAAIVRPIAPLIRERFPKTRRHVSGYNLHVLLDQLDRSSAGTFSRVNLSQLICGAEGTLALVTGAELALVPRPGAVGLAVMAMDSLDEALAAVPAILETQPSAVELLDDMVLALAPGNLECSASLALITSATGVAAPGAILYVEYFGADGAALNDSLSALRHRFAETPVAWITNPADMATAWALRKAGEPLLHSVPGGRKPVTFIEDTAVDPRRLHEYVSEMRTLIDSFGTRAAFYAHASVGCLHIRPMLDLHTARGVEHMERIAVAVAKLVRSFGGTLSGEHGDGRVRSPLLEEFFGPEITSAFRQVKELFDPEFRLNPGNIVAPGSVTWRLRTRPDDAFVSVPQVRTFFRYDKEHGFGSAVEMCNGAGVCRKRSAGGTMCPSYRATLDERHATRGRGNALRLAITGQVGGVGAPAFDDAETLETLRLCLSCKACKRECPSNVDIARLKAEYLAQSYVKRGGAPFAVRAMGNVRAAARVASRMPTLANAVARQPIARSLMHRFLGIDRRRSLPPAAISLFRMMRRRTRLSGAQQPAVVVFADCFTTYSEPHIGVAAIDVIEALGYRVVVPDAGCCGRAMISVGMLPEAIRACSKTAANLHRIMREERAEAIVGCEPSCVSAICDDWLDLDLDLTVPPQLVQDIAKRTTLIDQFVDREWSRLASSHQSASAARLLLFPHCHQNALWGAESSARALRRLAGDNLTVLDSGCCGMAGSFGYTTDRYDISMRIGELALFPAVRADPDAVVAAPGTSCRHQLRDALGVHALHPIELIAQGLATDQRNHEETK